MAPILGALFAILIGLFAIRPYLNYQQQSFENIKAANTASQFRQLIDAAETYVQATCLSNSNNSNVSASCQSVPLAQLISLGYLPVGTSTNGNPYGQRWYLNVTNSYGNIVGVLYSSGGSPIPTRLAAEISAETGQEGGFVPPIGLNSIYGLPTNGQLGAVGAYGHWNLSPLATYVPTNSGVVAGDLVALLNIATPSSSAGSSGDNDYLYRTAVQGDNGSLNTMQTDLGMGGHVVQNASGVNVTTSTPLSNTPFLARMVGTTTNTIPGTNTSPQGGMVETTDAGGDTAIMETDSTGSTLALTNKSKASTVSLADSANMDDFLQFISTAQTIGSSCSTNQIGTIAPDAAGSGMPVVCTKQAWGLSITPSSKPFVNNISYSLGTGSNSAAWQLIGGGATQSLDLSLSPFPVFYINNTEKPLFVASNCSPDASLLLNSSSIQFTIQGLNGGPPNQYSSATNSLTVLGVGGFADAPELSVIIPPNFIFNYTTDDVGTCSFMVTY